MRPSIVKHEGAACLFCSKVSGLLRVAVIPLVFAGFAAARFATTYLMGLALERFSSRYGIGVAMIIVTPASGWRPAYRCRLSSAPCSTASASGWRRVG